MENVTREDIAQYINEEFGLTKKDCNKVVNDLIDEIINGLIRNKIVKIHNFGTFKLKKKNKRIGRNPKTKKETIISERNVILFKPSKFLKNKINNVN